MGLHTNVEDQTIKGGQQLSNSFSPQTDANAGDNPTNYQQLYEAPMQCHNHYSQQYYQPGCACCGQHQQACRCSKSSQFEFDQERNGSPDKQLQQAKQCAQDQLQSSPPSTMSLRHYNEQQDECNLINSHSIYNQHNNNHHRDHQQQNNLHHHHHHHHHHRQQQQLHQHQPTSHTDHQLLISGNGSSGSTTTISSGNELLTCNQLTYNYDEHEDVCAVDGWSMASDNCNSASQQPNNLDSHPFSESPFRLSLGLTSETISSEQQADNQMGQQTYSQLASSSNLHEIVAKDGQDFNNNSNQQGQEQHQLQASQAFSTLEPMSTNGLEGAYACHNHFDAAAAATNQVSCYSDPSANYQQQYQPPEQGYQHQQVNQQQQQQTHHLLPSFGNEKRQSPTSSSTSVEFQQQQHLHACLNSNYEQRVLVDDSRQHHHQDNHHHYLNPQYQQAAQRTIEPQQASYKLATDNSVGQQLFDVQAGIIATGTEHQLQYTYKTSYSSLQQLSMNCDKYANNQVVSTTTTPQEGPVQEANKVRSLKGRRGRPRKKGLRSKNKVNGKLWEFIRDLLLSDRTNPSFIRWERREDGVFKFVQSDKVAKMWGERKQNPKMTYEKLSRAMRYYYKSKVLLPVFGRRLVYKFGPNATGWLPNTGDAVY